MKPLFIALMFSTALGASASLAAASPASSQAAPVLGAQQAHAVRICENGACWWSRDHWGYGEGWRRHDHFYRDRDWRRDRDDYDDWDR
ncbi:MAG: hypothetical protein ACR652_14830 [Methylocystis sp.]|uniref:hypothetical protein n=1 Tax=Methylocystis sp. TaxID=1911079 RepID=UPI003DA45B00